MPNDDQLIKDLRLIAENARFNLSGITPRHSRYEMYDRVVRTAEAAIDRIQTLEKRLNENWVQR